MPTYENRFLWIISHDEIILFSFLTQMIFLLLYFWHFLALLNSVNITRSEKWIFKKMLALINGDNKLCFDKANKTDCWCTSP